MKSVSFERLAVVNGMPRSGTSWLEQIIESCPQVRYRLSPLFAYEFKGRIGMESSKEDWLDLLQEAYVSDNEYMTRGRERADGRYPVFEKESENPPVFELKFDRFHELMPQLLRHFEADGIRLVFIVRHPCGAMHSWLTAPKEFPQDTDPLAHWRDGRIKKREYGDYFGFDDWKLVTRLQMEMAMTHPRHARILRYERLVADPVSQTRELFDFLELPVTPRTLDFVDASHARHDADEYSVFKAPEVKDRWKTELHPAIRDAILNELRGTDLEPFLDE